MSPACCGGAAYFSVLFEGNSNVAIGGKTDLVAFDIRHQTDIDVVMMAGLMTLPAIIFGHLDAAGFDVVNGADMNAVGSNNLHMRLDLACIHDCAPPGKDNPCRVVWFTDSRPDSEDEGDYWLSAKKVPIEPADEDFRIRGNPALTA